MSIKFKFKSMSLAVLCAGSLGACSLFATDDGFEPVELPEQIQQVQGRIHWSANIGAEGAYGFAPVVVGNDVFAATPRGSVAKVDLASGAIRWKVDLGSDLSSGVGSDGNIVVVGALDGRIIALDARQGNQLWDAKGSTLSSTPAVVTNGLVIVRSDDYRVQAFKADTGEEVWRYLRANAPLSLKANARMAVSSPALLVPVPIGRLVALDLQNGRPFWDLSVATPAGGTDLDTVTDVSGLPLVGNNSLCLSTYQGNVGCYQTANKGGMPAMVWTKPFSSSVGLGVGSDHVYAVGIHGEVTSFAINNGDMQWQDNTLRNRSLTNPAYFNNMLYVGDYEGYVHVYSAAGKLVGRIAVGDSNPIRSPLTVTQNGVLVQTGNGNLVLVSAQ